MPNQQMPERSLQQRCPQCRFSHGPSTDYIVCRRHAPRARSEYEDEGDFWGVWPRVNNVDWCGEWEARNA